MAIVLSFAGRLFVCFNIKLGNRTGEKLTELIAM